MLPRVTEKARELVAREFDARGPDACVAEIVEHLEQHNPEVLDMAVRCAADLGEAAKAMVGFTMFYRLLTGQLPGIARSSAPTLVPRVTAQTRALLVAEIDDQGAARFTREAIAAIEEDNPELLQMAHGFASALKDYLRAMQGFALLVVQSLAERVRPH